MQSLVSDVNSAVNLYRINAMNAYKDQNAELARTCLYGLNAMLPDDLRIIFDEDLALEAGKPNTTIKCPHCKKHIAFDGKTVTRPIRYQTYLGSAFTQKRKLAHVVVPCNCGQDIPYSRDIVFDEQPNEIARLYYMPPPRIGGIISHMTSAPKFWKWFTTTWQIIELKHRQARQNVSAPEEDIDA